MSEIKFYPGYNNTVSYETQSPKEQKTTTSIPTETTQKTFSSSDTDASKAVYGSVLGGIQYQAQKNTTTTPEEKECFNNIRDAIIERDVTKFIENNQKLDTLKTEPKEAVRQHLYELMALTDSVSPEQKEEFLKQSIKGNYSHVRHTSRLELANLYYSQGKKDEAKELLYPFFDKKGELIQEIVQSASDIRNISTKNYNIPPKSADEIKKDIEKIMAE